MKTGIVIGGGAAGMMAAIAAADAGASVCLLEKNEKLGKKLFLTGKGRCNVTNAADREALFSHVVSNPKFLYSAFSQFDNRAMMDFLEKAGCRLKVERGERVFPASGHSSDVIAALAGQIQERGIKVKLNTPVSGLWYRKDAGQEKGKKAGPGLEDLTDGTQRKKDPSPKCAVKGVLLSNGEKLVSDFVIIATGGLSYPGTGSTGDGYRFAEESGHKLVEMSPSLVPMNAEEPWCQDLMGLSLRNVSVRLFFQQKEIYSGFGEMLFTHFGVSGPLILSASSYLVQAYGRCAKKSHPVWPCSRLLIDLKPALSQEQLDKRILRDFEANKKKQFKNALNGLFPLKLIPVMIALSGISPDKRVNEITREERACLVHLTKNLPLTITGVRDYNEAVITKGGVDVRDVNPSTMGSRRVKGLFFAGEVLDLDALTGGFNLQIAWSTGYLAGKSAGEGTLKHIERGEWPDGL